MNSETKRYDRLGTDRSTFVILLSMYFVVLFPILRADRYYNDDLKRALIGRQSWDATGRPLTTLLMRALQCYDHLMVDISPLPQFGAIVILAWIGVLIGRRYDIRSPWMAALAAFPLGAQPFFLENLSYKFDSLNMSLAMWFALAPILAVSENRRGWWLGVLSLFVSLNLYQAAINAFLVFIVLEVVLAQLKGWTPREVVKQFFFRGLQAGVTMLLYELIVGIHINGWVKQNSEKIHDLQELPLIGKNFVDFYTYVGSSFDIQWWLYFGPVLAVMALFPIVVGVRYAIKESATQNATVKAIAVLTSFFVPLTALACALGPLLVLVKPLIQPRVLMGVGALLSMALITTHVANKAWRHSEKWSLAAGSMLAIGMSVFASAYGNALSEQKNYEERIASRLADDLAELHTMNSVNAFLLDGTAGYSPVTEHVAEQFPLMRSLIPTYIAPDDKSRRHIFLQYFMTDDMIDLGLQADESVTHKRSTILSRAHEVQPTRATRAYEIRLIDGAALVSFSSVSLNRNEPESSIDDAQ
jgi:hypothetical protein